MDDGNNMHMQSLVNGVHVNHGHVTISQYEETMRDVMDVLVYRMDDARQQLLHANQQIDICAYADTISKLAQAIKAIQELQE
jgi:hypothetical protein